MQLIYKTVEDINAVKDPQVKYSQFILLIKSLVDEIKLSKRPLLTLIKEYKKVIEIFNTIKNFVFDPTYKPVSVLTGMTITPEEKTLEVEDMIKTAEVLNENKVSIPAEIQEPNIYTSTRNLNAIKNRKFKK